MRWAETVYYVLVEVDHEPVLVKVPDVEYPNLYAKYNYCHKLPPVETCDIGNVYKESEFNEKVLIGHYTIRCGKEVVKEDLIELEDKEELELIKKDYEDVKKEYEGYYGESCEISANLLEMSRLEYRIIRYYESTGLDTRTAMSTASRVVNTIVDLTKNS